MASSQQIRYVGLDLETTGLDHRNHEIIEIGIVTPTEGAEREIYTTVVHAGQPLTQEIIDITGITQAEVDDAPDIQEVINEVADRIEGACIVGHNIRFDTEFLSSNGLRRTSGDESIAVLANTTELDTFSLAQVLAPLHLASLSLTTLSEYYEIIHTDAHRAWSDAAASLDLLEYFQREIESISPTLWVWYSYIIARLDPAHPFRQFFENARSLELASYDQIRESILLVREKVLSSTHFGESTTVQESEENVKDESADELFSQLAKIFDEKAGMEPRPTQREMQQEILSCLENKTSILIEAPTGIGKTFGYLLPSIAYANATKSHIAISTRTKALQDQLFEKDLPRLATMAKSMDIDLSYTLLKGRSNYVSLVGVLDALEESYYSLRDAILIMRMLRVIHDDPIGDIDSMNWYASDMTLLSSLNASHPQTLSQSNPYFDLEPIVCARERASQAHIIVINHSLLATEIESDIMNRIMPHVGALIVDETHALESSITSVMTARFDIESIRKLCDRFVSRRSDFEVKLGREVFDDFVRHSESVLLEMEMLVSLLLDHEKVRNSLGRDQGGGYGKGKTYEVYVDANILSDDTFRQKSFLLSSLSSHLQTIDTLLDGKSVRFIQIIERAIHDGIAFLQMYFSANPGVVRSINQRRDQVLLSYAPVRISGPLQSYIQDVGVVIGVSATLAINGNFEYICNRLGMAGVRQLQYGEIFDYSRQAVVLIPSDISNIKSVIARERAYEILGEAIEINHGCTLGLFTSYDQVREASQALKQRLKLHGIELYSQGNGSRKKILEAFRNNAHGSALFGTDAFWEGIDISGDGLSLLSIFKLPFLVPTDPIYIARSAEYSDPFAEYAIPEMILKLRQGIGRLIRSPQDTGVIVIFDDRLVTTSWGARLADALPNGLKIHHVSSRSFLDLYREKKLSKQKIEIPQ